MLVGPLSRERPQSSSLALRVRWLDRQVAGYILMLSGTLADLVAGWSILARPAAWAILVHIPAILTWTLGLQILQRSGAPQADAPTDEAGARVHDAGPLVCQWKGLVASTLRRPELVALLLGLLLFPGLIPLGWCLGFGLAYAQRITRRPGFSLASDEAASREVAPEQPATNIDPRLSVQGKRAGITSLEDALRDPNVEVRRGAIALLGQLATGEAVTMLRRLLVDSHADVRLDASITLARLEAKFSRAVNEAAKERSSSPSALRAYASQCLDYSCSGLLDPVSSGFYLTEARTALHAYLAHDPESTETWVTVARLHVDLGQMAEASHAVNHAIALPDPPAEAFLLAMEIAFQERKWEQLIALAGQVRQSPLDVDDLAVVDEKLRIMRWWSELPGEPQVTSPPGAMLSAPQAYDERAARATEQTGEEAEIWSGS